MSFFRNLLIERKRKPYYCEVEYLESNSTQQRISTGIIVDTLPITIDTVISTSATYNSFYQVIVGTVTGSQYFVGLTSGDPTFAVKYNNFTYDTQVVPVADTIYRLKSTISTSTSTLSIDGTDYTNTRTYTANNEEIGLFAQNYNTGSNRIYTCKIYKGSTLVRDFIPVLDFSFKPCMYDKVSGKLFYNQNTSGDDFTYGREIHYVDYLESTGTQYIDTGIAGSSTLRIEMEGQKTGSSLGVYFGAGTGDSRIQAVYVNGYNSARIGNVTIVELGSDSERFNIVCDALNKTVTYNGTEYPFAYKSSLTNLNIFMFTRNQGEGSYADKATAKCWFLKMWDNNTLVRDYIPAIDENGVGFMFDRTTHTIFDNAGTGVFHYPPVELEYIESTGTQYIDTGLDYFADFEVSIQLRNSVANKALGNGAYYCMQRYNANNPYWYFSTGTGASNSYITSTPIIEHHVMKWKDNKIYSDDVLLTEFTKDLNASNRMYLFGVDGNAKYPNMIYFCKLWNPNDGVLVRDFMPCYKDGVSGMWDKANNVFYGNAGTGTFVAGKIIESRWF